MSQPIPATPESKPVVTQEPRARQVNPLWQAIIVLCGSATLLLALNQLLNLGFFVGATILDTSYLYLIGALLVGIVFLTLPANAKASRTSVPWYDVLCFVLCAVVFVYFAFNAHRIISEAWEFMAPPLAVGVSIVGWLLLLEATRRAGGTAVFVVVAIISLYPVYADMMPGPISGLPQDFATTMAYHFTSSESVMGIPMRAFGELVIGFVMFGAVLQFTGAA